MKIPIPVIFDCDPGVDDAIAIALALSAPRSISVKALTVSAGNQTLAKTLSNAKRVLHFLRPADKPPVAAGAAAPVMRVLETAENVHGESGLGGVILPDSPQCEESCGALELMRRIVCESGEPITIIATGPLTNVALFLTAHSELKSKIAHISIMGGSVREGGNTSAVAEFNFAIDPEAADIVFRAGVPLTLCPLDVTHKAFLLPDEIKKLRAAGNVGNFMANLMDFPFSTYYQKIGFAGSPMHDPCSVAALIDSSLFKSISMHIDIETKGEHSSGMSIADLRPDSEALPNASVCMDVDRARFVDLLLGAAAFYGAK